MAESSSMWSRMFARFQGEVPGAALEAYRRASLPVFELMDRVEARREACIADGLNPWTIPPATRAEFLCAWNAFVLQTLGNDILNADYAEYPDTAGYVPPVTADQLLSFFGQVEGWMDRAQQAHANPDYRLDVEVPAALPPWSEVEPNPASHLRGLLKAMRAVGEHAAAGMRFLPETAPEGPEQAARQKQIHRIRQLYASAQSKARYAADLHGAEPPPDVRERVEPYAREAIELFYELGQLIADPALADGDTPAAPAAELAKKAPAAAPVKKAPAATPVRNAPAVLSDKKTPLLPAAAGFDPWILTDPSVRDELKLNWRACDAIARMWEADTDPARTRSVQAQIQTALERGDVGLATDRSGVRVGRWFRCPWGPIYVVRRTCRIHGAPMVAGQQFVLEISVPNRERKVFTRRIRCGNFQGTEELEFDDVGTRSR
jgi:hypothetical protein